MSYHAPEKDRRKSLANSTDKWGLACFVDEAWTELGDIWEHCGNERGIKPHMPGEIAKEVDRRLTALQSRIDELTTLRPMADAPRDGTRVLAYNHVDEEWQVIAWESNGRDQEKFFWYSGHSFLDSFGESDFLGFVHLPEIEGGAEI